ncbi:hypothetical protein [Pendulispora albinea]|uniref:Uncharacterized protein n=1 Tax=Pendulispora albinea TaxID=2741071 RepID=A0ABZ2M7P2_9BACT
MLLLSACTASSTDAPEGGQRASKSSALSGTRTKTRAVRAAKADCSSYTVTDLGTLPGGRNSTPDAIDDAGHVTGTAWVTSVAAPVHAFAGDGNGITDLGTLGGENSFGQGINGGRVVGQSNVAGGGTHAFLHDGSGLHDLGTLGGTDIYDNSSATDVNASGVAVGTSRLPNGFERAVRFQNGAVVDLGTLRGGLESNSIATAINDSGLVVGSSDSASGPVRATAWSNGTITDLGVLAACTRNCSSSASAVNASGVVAGSARVDNTTSHPVIYRGGAVIDLGLAPKFQTGAAYGINDAGYVVGNMTYRQGEIVVRHGFVHDGSSLRDLNDLVQGSGWQITDARDINNSGQIAATGVDSNGTFHALVLTPDCAPPVGPQFVSISSAVNNPTVFAPDGVAAGDLLVAAIQYCAHPVNITPPPGWTLVADQIAGEGTDQVFHELVYSRVATASEPSEYTFQRPSEDVYVDVQVAAYSGASAIDKVASTTTTGGAIAAPSVTTSQTNERLVAVFTGWTAGNWSIAPGMTERSNFDANSLQDESIAAAGPTGSREAVNNEGVMTAVSIAIK